MRHRRYFRMRARPDLQRASAQEIGGRHPQWLGLAHGYMGSALQLRVMPHHGNPSPMSRKRQMTKDAKASRAGVELFRDT